MQTQRKQEIVQRLIAISTSFVPTDDEPELTMFGLVSRYNQQYDNPERIGGAWVRENVPELADLP